MTIGQWLLQRIENQSKRMTRRGLNRFLDQAFADIAPQATVLSIGAGGPINRHLSRHARSRDFQVATLDVDPDRGPDIVGDICSADLRDHVYDVVVMAEVLEHIQTPQLALDRIRTTLKPNGTLILTTPFLFPLHNKPRDFFRYTRYGLEWLLRDYHDVIINERAGWAETLIVLPGRLYKEPGTAVKIAAGCAVLIGRPLLPLARLLHRLAPRDFLTIGYVVTARARG